MPSILVLLREPELTTMRFDRLARPPEITVRTAGSVAEALPLLGETDILVTLGPHLGPDAATLFRQMTRLRWVQVIGTGSDNIAEHLAGRDVALTSARGLHGRQMSEAALAMMLALARQLPRVVRNQGERRWERFPSTLLADRTVGILGLGAIADALAPRCRALGMRVIGITERARTVDGFDEVRLRGDLPRAVADLDYLVLLTPYSAETRHIVNAAVLDSMKPGAFLINLARGGVVDEAALLAALDAETLAGAAFDVFETEPLPPGDPLWNHPRLLVTPHIGGLHDDYADDVVALTAENLRRFLAKGDAAAFINRVALPEVPSRAA